MPDYTNYMRTSNTPTIIKVMIVLLIGIKILCYKKHKISRYIEEYFSDFILTYLSLTFVLFTSMVFPTFDKDLYLAVFSIITGIGIGLSYLYNINKEASNSHLEKKWLIVIFGLALDTVIFFLIPDKNIGYIFSLIQCLIAMIYETKKAQSKRTGN